MRDAQVFEAVISAKTLPARMERDRDPTKFLKKSNWTFGIVHAGNDR